MILYYIIRYGPVLIICLLPRCPWRKKCEIKSEFHIQAFFRNRQSSYRKLYGHLGVIQCEWFFVSGTLLNSVKVDEKKGGLLLFAPEKRGWLGENIRSKITKILSKCLENVCNVNRSRSYHVSKTLNREPIVDGISDIFS